LIALSLPAQNAVFNASSAVLLLAGYFFIKRKNVAAHRVSMSLAFFCSVAFLAGYLLHHFRVGVTHFPGTGGVRLLYLGILFTHTILATILVPLVLVTLALALRGIFERHKAWARWTWPVWMYVSVTGVVIYGMLYHLP